MTIELDETDILCPKCNGELPSLSSCTKCYGAGKLDWIERIVGKLLPEDWWGILGGWDVSNVTTMTDMFKNCTAFNQPMNWDSEEYSFKVDWGDSNKEG